MGWRCTNSTFPARYTTITIGDPVKESSGRFYYPEVGRVVSLGSVGRDILYILTYQSIYNLYISLKQVKTIDVFH